MTKGMERREDTRTIDADVRHAGMPTPPQRNADETLEGSKVCLKVTPGTVRREDTRTGAADVRLVARPEENPSGGGSRMGDVVNHPSHYGGDSVYEVIKVLEAWGLIDNAYLFNVVKYIARAKNKGKYLEDLEKACFYLQREIERTKNGQQ